MLRLFCISKNRFYTLFCFTLISLSFSCKKTENLEVPNKQEKTKLDTRFQSLSSKETGINFVNKLEETLESNYYQYLYTYIGGGVAAGDLNDDGYIDLYFTSNTGEDKLYMNLGDFNFRDVTANSGINHKDGFNAGVTMADVNNDGLLDIYVCRGGWIDEDNKFSNKLYINQGDFVFTEESNKYGLDDSNRSIQATFFDYDNDNDLDVYISNTPDITGKSKVQDLSLTYQDSKNLALKGCDRLYNNDGKGHFTDVSKKAGILYDIGFGLNPQVADLNNDGLLDLYVCNDFDFPDLVYINKGDGTFKESRDKLFKHMSYNSMGSDFSDINNDGLPELATLDMNPEDYIRSKTTMSMTPLDKFESMVDNGYHYQYMHNMLQLNNGNGTYSEISKMSGMANTDWSWSILSADFDLDGYNDYYITNGVFRDVNDRDVLNKSLDILKANGRKPNKEDFLQLTKLFTQQKLNNYFYKNQGDLTFKNVSTEWSNEPATFSNGAAYADLDNDGDLDIVVNNINDEASILKNNTLENKRLYYLKLDFVGPGKNIFGVGTKANLHFEDGSIQSKQVINTRGFLSAVPNQLHFGLNKKLKVDRLEIIWPDGKTQELKDVMANQSLLLNYRFSKEKTDLTKQDKTIFTKTKTNYKHIDPYFNDYDLQILLPHKLSQLGPSLAKTDVNNDGIEDVFIGGANGHAGQLLLGNKNGAFHLKKTQTFYKDKKYEDIGATFFDADNDGDEDLYIVSGSYEYYGYPEAFQDRLYLNNGNGNFSKSEGLLPEIKSAGSIVKAKDFDNDGDLDLFVGGRLIPGKYPYAATSYLLQNNKGKFSNITNTYAPELENIGMITDAFWTDINNDKKLDLIVTGEWMGIEIFLNENGKLIKSSNYKNLSNAKGWWNRLLVADIDDDGDNDIIAGNLGLNYKFHASPEKPFHIYTKDFDFDGVEDIVMAKDYNGKQVPVRGKTCMTQQMPHLAQKIPTYNEFANKELSDILGKGIETSLHYKVTELRSGIFVNNGDQGFSFEAFNNHVQQSPINSIIYEDLDGDTIKDLVLAGNNHMSEVETTKADSGIGSFLKGRNNGEFDFIPNLKSGLFLDKDVRNMILVKSKKRQTLFIVNNNDTHDVYHVNN